jgi:hypothetical protein
MGFSTHVLPEHRLGVVRLADRVDGSALVEAFGLLVHDAAWAPGFSAVWDARLVRDLTMRAEDAPRLAEAQAALRARHGPGRTAVLARYTLDATTARILRVRWGATGERHVQGFFDKADAAAWLGVPVDTLRLRYAWPVRASA